MLTAGQQNERRETSNSSGMKKTTSLVSVVLLATVFCACQKPDQLKKASLKTGMKSIEEHFKSRAEIFIL
jgi:hypothetical protein